MGRASDPRLAAIPQDAPSNVLTDSFSLIAGQQVLHVSLQCGRAVNQLVTFIRAIPLQAQGRKGDSMSSVVSQVKTTGE